jgi:hypothetical protein
MEVPTPKKPDTSGLPNKKTLLSMAPLPVPVLKSLLNLSPGSPTRTLSPATT